MGRDRPRNGRNPKIHIIAHSMGGMTARMIAQILAQGQSSRDGSLPEDASPFFTGGKNWIKSITTLSTPHDGTTLAYEMTSYRQRELIADLALGFMVRWDRISFSIMIFSLISGDGLSAGKGNPRANMKNGSGGPSWNGIGRTRILPILI